MSAPDKKLTLLPLSKQEDCLREVKSAGGKPWHLIMYAWLNFGMPSMFRNLMWAVVILGTAYIGVMNK